MSLVVMKFGGTSVEDPAAITRTAAIVAGRVAMGKQTVVVVSAMAKVTDMLLRAAAAAASGDRTGALAISSRLRCRHRDTAAALVKSPADSVALCHQVTTLDRLKLTRRMGRLSDDLVTLVDEGLMAALDLPPRP